VAGVKEPVARRPMRAAGKEGSAKPPQSYLKYGEDGFAGSDAACGDAAASAAGRIEHQPPRCARRKSRFGSEGRPSSRPSCSCSCSDGKSSTSTAELRAASGWRSRPSTSSGFIDEFSPSDPHGSFPSCRHGSRGARSSARASPKRSTGPQVRRQSYARRGALRTMKHIKQPPRAANAALGWLG